MRISDWSSDVCSSDLIDTLMGESRGNTKKLLEIMQLMDDYLEHIGCPKLYLMLKDSDGTKEGMFVDLHADLKRIEVGKAKIPRSEEHTSELQSLMRISYAVFCLKKKQPIRT